MNKFAAVYKNEMTKLILHGMTIVFTAVALIVAVGLPLAIWALSDTSEYETGNYDAGSPSEELDTYLDGGSIYTYGTDGSVYAIIPDSNDITQLKRAEKVLEYIENNDNDSSAILSLKSEVKSYTFLFSFFFISVACIGLAASTVSSEMTSGTIKFLLVAPIRRSRFFWAKFLSILTYLVVSVSVLTLVTDLISAGLFGTGELNPYVYYSVCTGKVLQMPEVVFDLLRNLAGMLEVVFFCSLAIMLSSLLKSNAFSVIASLMAYFSVSVVNAVTSAVIPASYPYLPFANVDIGELFFPYEDYASSSVYDIVHRAVDMGDGLPAWGSLIYYAGMTAILLYAGYCAFKRKDIGL